MASRRQVEVIALFSGLATGYGVIVLNKGFEVLVLNFGAVDVVR